MKKIYCVLFWFACSCMSMFAQDVDIVKPFAPINDSIPDYGSFVEQNELNKMDGDTVTLNMPYSKMPYWREDSTWGVVNGDIYITFDNIMLVGKEEVSNQLLYYLRDYKNKKPTRFVLCSETEASLILKKAHKDGEIYRFLRPEKFVILVDQVDKNKVTLKRVYIPKYFRVEIED